MEEYVIQLLTATALSGALVAYLSYLDRDKKTELEPVYLNKTVIKKKKRQKPASLK